MARQSKSTVLSPAIPIYRNHGVARLVREADPSGSPAEHQRVISGRMIDLLYHEHQIDGLQHQAGTMLRDDYERAGVSLDALPASDPGTPQVSGGEHALLRDERAWKRHRNTMQQLRQWYPILRVVCIEDRHPSIYGTRMRCHGPGELRMALDALVRHYQLVARGGETRIRGYRQ